MTAATKSYAGPWVYEGQVAGYYGADEIDKTTFTVIASSAEVAVRQALRMARRDWPRLRWDVVSLGRIGKVSR